MMRTYGSAVPSDETCEIRVIQGREVVAVFRESTIDDLEVHDSAPHIPYAEVALTLEVALHLPILANGNLVEIWSGQGETMEHRRFRGVVDYVETGADAGVTKISLQARGVGAALVDAPFKGDVGTTLAEVVEAVSRGVGLSSSTTYPETDVTAWLNAASSYGALRLLAANFDAVVRTHDDVVEFVSSKAYLARLKSAPPVPLNVSDVKTSRTVQGRPIKK